MKYLLILLFFCAVVRLLAYNSWDLGSLVRGFSESPSEKSSCLGTIGDKGGITGQYCRLVTQASYVKGLITHKVQEMLPSPHSELILGMVTGENLFNELPRYNDVLRTAGLVHVVVVSGYNISLVFNLFASAFHSYRKSIRFFICSLITFSYVAFTGFGIPAVRSYIMALTLSAYSIYGNRISASHTLFISAFVIILISPAQLYSLSFQLSFLATFGLLHLSDRVSYLFSPLLCLKGNIFGESFLSSVSAYVAVMPLISYHFGSVSMLSVFANTLVLWVVPLCTVGGALLIAASFACKVLAHAIAFLLFPFVDFFVFISEVFAEIPFSSINFTFDTASILCYHLFLFLVSLVPVTNKSKEFDYD